MPYPVPGGSVENTHEVSKISAVRERIRQQYGVSNVAKTTPPKQKTTPDADNVPETGDY